MMKALSTFLLVLLVPGLTGAEVVLTNVTSAGNLQLTSLFTNGAVTLQSAAEVTGPWLPHTNLFTTAAATQATVVVTGNLHFVRAAAWDFSPGREGFTNLTRAYGLLTTIAGAGGSTEAINKWQTEHEGGPATNAYLSRPHIAVADRAGNIYIADKDAHGIRKILPNGTIVTVAGTNLRGDGPNDEQLGTEVALSEPNGLWVTADGKVYILDLMNGKIRRLGTNGMLTTLFTVEGGIPIGRGLWVSDDESLAYVAAGTQVLKWTPEGGVTNYVSGFVELANLVIDPWGDLVVTDRRANRVWRIDENGEKTVIAGNGSASVGFEGGLATATSLNQVRGVWFLPTGAYFLATHRGSQLWYVDTAGYIHLFVNGYTSDTHAGDGTWFYNPNEYRISELRAVTMDPDGNVLITEHDSGYIRKIQFLPIVAD